MEAAAGDGDGDHRLEFGMMEYGCEHYRRRCKIRAPCCGEVFGCRHCHNEATAKDDRHELPRHDVKRVICLVCDTEQPAAKVCSNCGVNMGEYFCDVCKFYDDETEKQQFHCDDCGICRVGGRENYFHCPKCGSCYVNALQDQHVCVENSMKHQCPICCEYLFDSLRDTRILNCGHTMHYECFREMLEHNQFQSLTYISDADMVEHMAMKFQLYEPRLIHQRRYTCPICYKSAVNMTQEWRNLDEEVAATVMPEDYRYKVWIFCNDCHKSSEVYFHVLGHKCANCKSYNTRTSGPPATSVAQ